jgi:hypothetical protein
MKVLVFLTVLATIAQINAQATGSCPIQYGLSTGQNQGNTGYCNATQCFQTTNSAASSITGNITGCVGVPVGIFYGSGTYNFSISLSQCNATATAISVTIGSYGSYTYTTVNCVGPNVTNATANSTTANSSCFSGDSLVETRDRGIIRISEIKEDDLLSAYDVNTNQKLFSKFVAFSHEDADLETSYVEIITESSKKLKISDYHLILKVDSEMTQFVFASELKVNDILLVASSNSELVAERIVSLRNVLDSGAYAPLTEIGTVIVNDVVASCYFNLRSHSLAHSVFPSFNSVIVFANSILKYKDTFEMATQLRLYAFFHSLFQYMPFVSESIIYI